MSEMEAGRELDALVAEKVMGWEKVEFPAHDGVVLDWWDGDARHCYFRPSTDIAAAWRVWERLPDELFGKKVCWMLERHGEETWIAPKFLIDEEDECPTWVWAIGSAPLAICLVALKAVNHV